MKKYLYFIFFVSFTWVKCLADKVNVKSEDNIFLLS